MGCCGSKTVSHEFTRTGKVINNNTVTHLVNRKDLERLMNRNLSTNSSEVDIIFKDIYNTFTYIIGNLYLTGFGGMTEKNIKENNIKGIISVTYECALFEIPGIKFVRIPADDSMDEDIYRYFDEVTFRIEKWTRREINVVIHCLCGISRSVTLVLAYLMRYNHMSLLKAFKYVKERRPFIRPNSSFFQQLIDYEKELYSTTTVKMVKHTTKKGIEILIPDFFTKEYPQEAEDEDNSLSDANIAPLFKQMP